MSYLSEWRLAQVYEMEATAVRTEIDSLEKRYTRIMEMAQEHRQLMALLMETEDVHS